ncbi:hypothetical protein JCM10908_001016 [Rhodotorula pacifica]|uniref:Rsc9p n=1 Tax=Rhodotorula pacifica TaxID=1495444 RepID=UPI0031757856
MSAIPGRPGASFASNRAAPQYAQPGVAKPATARGGQTNQARGSARALVREKWNRVFGGHAFLETGPSNRLVLSIRSGVPAEVDFGLDRLVQMTSIEPDLVRLSEFPGLLDGCLALVREYLDRCRSDRERGLPGLSTIVGQEARSVLRRRAGEAALILRNLAPESRSRDPLLASRKLVRVICDVLEEGQSGGLDVEETTEIRIYLLDVLECIAEHIPLALPGHAIAAGAEAAEDADRPPPKPEALDSPAVRLFPLLVALTRSTDRALILAGFRCLTALALNGKSDAVFALLTYENIDPLPKPYPHPIQTAIELLPVADAELNLAILEFIYQHTLLPSNAVLLAERPQLVGILRLLISKFHVRAKLEEVSIDLRVAPFDGRYYHDLHGLKHVRKPTSSPIQPTESLVSPEELAQLIGLVEPSRTLTWMRTAFEADPASSVPQVMLWTTYRSQFEPHARPDLPPLLAAADVIKASQQAFPNVLPMVSEEGGQRNFVIKGLKVRDRPDLRSRYRCRWNGCQLQSTLDSPLATHQHVLEAHLAYPEPKCLWGSCTYSSPQKDPRLLRGDLALHIRTHIPTSPPSADEGVNPPEVPCILHHERIHAEREAPTADSNATGIGFFAALTIRNLDRIAKLAVDAQNALRAAGPKGASGSALVASGNSAIGRLAEGEQSIFEAFAAAAEGAARSGSLGVFERLEKVQFEKAFPLAEALVGLQGEINRTVMRDVSLGKVLGETALQIEECRVGMARLTAPAPVEEPAEATTRGDVEMQA